MPVTPDAQLNEPMPDEPANAPQLGQPELAQSQTAGFGHTQSASELDVIYQDPDILVVSKPSGLLSVPGRGPDKQDCVLRRLASRQALLVHRLDMDTSGLLVLARHRRSQKCLARQFQSQQVRKRYTAVVEGKPEATSGEIRLPLRLDVDNRPHQIYDPIHGKLGVTHWSQIAPEGSRMRIAFWPRTGRTHQLRVHAAHRLGLGCPIVGDRLYGPSGSRPPLWLHADMLAFVHPRTAAWVTFYSSAPF